VDETQAVASQEHADLEIIQLTDQAKRGDLSGLRQYLARTREEADWNDRTFVLDRVVPWIPLPTLDFACDTEPSAADLFVIRTSFFSSLAWKKRGSGTADKITEDRWNAASNCIKEALAARDRAVQLDPQDPTSHVRVLQSLGIFCPLWPEMQSTFQRAISLAPTIVDAHRPIVSIMSKRWGGSHEQSLEFARSSFAKAAPGGDMAFCLFWAHFLVYTHYLSFDDNKQDAEQYLHSSRVADELNAAFDAWTQAPYVPRRASVPLLHHAAVRFYMTHDLDRLRKALSLIGGVFYREPWNFLGDARTVFDRATLIAAGKKPDEPEDFEYLDICFAAIASCQRNVTNNDLPRALASLVVALQKSQHAPAEQQPHLKPLVMLSMSWLNLKMRKEKDATKLREDAIVLLDAIETPILSARYQFQLGEALERVGEWRRSIPIWEQAIAQASDDTEPQRIATVLHKMGEAYVKIGANEQAAIPLRSALKIYRNLSGDPRLPTVLLTLGNALRKIEPAQAEACYRDAAQLHEAAMKPQSATAAWANLGLLCSEQKRFDEALAFQQKTLRIREQNPNSLRTSMASILNNIANTYRRMRRFKEAHDSIDRAIKYLSANDTMLAAAYGTRGDIFEDAGDDKHAAEWHRKACDERSRQPSTNLEDYAHNLEHAIATLSRLGKTKDVPQLEHMLTSVRASLAAIPKGEFDEDKGKDPAESAAVIIELRIGLGANRPGTRASVAAFARSLRNEVDRLGAGRYTGSISVPEMTTLTFTCKDSEFLFRALEPHLTAEEICAGAKIIIRQGLSHRDVLIPVRREMVN